MKLSYILTGILLSVVVYSSIPKYSTTSVVTIVGSVIASSSDSVDKKYKRKDCPVCKGKGWYMSGDGIKKIDCQYCEPEPATTKPYLLIK